MNDFVVAMFTYLIAPIVSAVVAYQVGKRKTNAEASATELDNVEKSLAIYRGIISDLQVKLKEAEALVTQLQVELNDLRKKHNNAQH